MKTDFKPARGAIYWVKLDPTVGNETQKTRSCVVLNKRYSRHRVALVAPLLTHQDWHKEMPTFYKPIVPNGTNGLEGEKVRIVEVFQTRAVDIQRFVAQADGEIVPKGYLTEEQISFVTTALTAIL